MDVDARAMPRPRKLIWITLALAVAMLGMGLRWASPALSPAGVTHVPLWFDIAFGLGGAAGIAWAARRLWMHHRRDLRAAGFALTCWTVLAAGVTLRSALFAQADYERGRLPFFVLGTVVAGVMALAMLARTPRSAPQPGTHPPAPSPSRGEGEQNIKR